MVGMMDVVLYGGLAIVGLNIFKPDILPDFLQIPQLQNLIPLPGAGGAPEDGGAGEDASTEDPSANDGQGGHSGGGKHGGHRRKGKHRHSGFARAYAVGYGQDFFG